MMSFSAVSVKLLKKLFNCIANEILTKDNSCLICLISYRKEENLKKINREKKSFVMEEK